MNNKMNNETFEQRLNRMIYNVILHIKLDTGEETVTVFSFSSMEEAHKYKKRYPELKPKIFLSPYYHSADEAIIVSANTQA